MHFSIWPPPGDRDAVSTGVLLLGMWVWWLGISVYFPYRKAKWLKKNPSYSDVIDKVFSVYAKGRFSSLGRLTYATWFFLSMSLIALGYVDDDVAATRVRPFMLSMIPLWLFVAGLHFYLNSRFLDIIPTVRGATDDNYNIETLRSWDRQDAWIFQAFGLVMIGLSLFLLSCGFFNFPLDLPMLLALLQK